MNPHSNPAPTEEELLFKFSRAFEKELNEISERRKLAGFDQQATREGEDKALRRTLVGLALSGGGIRSATFCLGLLQKMHEMGLLRAFDYLSTVSGGGYLGSWWSAWLARPQFGGADLREPEEFVETLLASNDSLSKLIIGSGFSDRTRVLFGDAPGQGCYSECLKREGLARALNRVIEGECIYEPLRFEHVALSEQTKRLLEDWRERRGKGEELDSSQQVWLNRLLLEDAYRDFLERPIFPPSERS
ncbi:MAG TPA: hypothetical protein VFF31_20600, partial [Blastocatellia bacterium]|nr:hypothetical protein [Blastocatellia bacterium]